MNPDGIRLMIDAFDENDDGQIGKIENVKINPFLPFCNGVPVVWGF